MIQDRHCKECLQSFRGGPRAFYCPECRAIRKKQAKAEYLERKRNGDVREIGSKDNCERCGKAYTVEGGLQRFCPDCQPIHAAEYDRETSIDFYHEHKDRINPPRNERRRIGMTACKWCRKEFPMRVGGPVACSDECRRQLNNKWQREFRSKRKKCANCGDRFVITRSTSKYCSARCRFQAQAREKRKKYSAAGRCPQCGGEWVEPLFTIFQKKPQHCLRCQEYYQNRYKQK